MSIDYQNVVKLILFNELITECEVIQYILTNYKYDESLVQFIYKELFFECLAKNSYQLCTFLINLPNIDLNITNNEGQTPLIYCCQLMRCDSDIENLSQLANQIIKLGASLDIQDSTGHNSLMYSCMSSKSQSVTINLINHGCQLNQLNKDNQTALSYLCDHTSYLIYRIRCSNNYDEEYQKIKLIIDSETIPLIKLMIDKGANPNLLGFMNRTILDECIYLGNYYLALKLIDLIPSLKYLDKSLFSLLNRVEYNYNDDLIKLFDVMMNNGAKLIYCDENKVNDNHTFWDEPIIGNYHLNDQIKNIIVNTMIKRQDWTLLKTHTHILKYSAENNDPYYGGVIYRFEKVPNVFLTYLMEHNLMHLVNRTI